MRENEEISPRSRKRNNEFITQGEGGREKFNLSIENNKNKKKGHFKCIQFNIFHFHPKY